MLRIQLDVLEWLVALAPLIRCIAVRDSDLAAQLRRAATSVSLNLAEGARAVGGNKRRANVGTAADAGTAPVALLSIIAPIMPDPSLLETFDSPVSTPFVVEHVSEEFTSVCPRTGHPDFGRVIVKFIPDQRCVELKSLKLYYQSFRNEGIFYEAVTNRIRDDLVAAMAPRALQVTTEWRGRGGISSRIIATHGDVPEMWER